jgi:hypothetical protein
MPITAHLSICKLDAATRGPSPPQPRHSPHPCACPSARPGRVAPLSPPLSAFKSTDTARHGQVSKWPFGYRTTGTSFLFVFFPISPKSQGPGSKPVAGGISTELASYALSMHAIEILRTNESRTTVLAANQLERRQNACDQRHQTDGQRHSEPG